jgi:hypothetical protein
MDFQGQARRAFSQPMMNMNRKQRAFLGNAYSERVDTLLVRLEQLSEKRVVFDRDIVPDPVFGIAGGQYHINEPTPRISLPQGAAEITAAHEMLHGILDHEHYPQYQPQHRKTFPFITDVVREVAHCAIHIVIDFRLHAMGFDVQLERAERAEARMKSLAKIDAEVRDPQLRHWRYIRVAEEIATAASFPTDNSSLAEHFMIQARKDLPGCLSLAQRFTTIAREMKVDKPEDVQQSLRNMLTAVEAEYWAYSYFTNLQRLALIAPVFVSQAQLDSPANATTRFDVGTLRKAETADRSGTVVLLAEKLSGVTWGIATSESRDDQEIGRALEQLAKEPLKEVLRYCQVKHVVR